MDDLISRQAAIDALDAIASELHERKRLDEEYIASWCAEIIEDLPSAQPFHNITMKDVLKYIDGMPEDVWQEFTACLECRGWDLQRRVAKWCGGEFA